MSRTIRRDPDKRKQAAKRKLQQVVRRDSRRSNPVYQQEE